MTWRTSYVKVPPEESGCRRVTFEITPFAERIQIARGPCWENDMIFIVTSFSTAKHPKKKRQYSIISYDREFRAENNNSWLCCFGCLDLEEIYASLRLSDNTPWFYFCFVGLEPLFVVTSGHPLTLAFVRFFWRSFCTHFVYFFSSAAPALRSHNRIFLLAFSILSWIIMKGLEALASTYFACLLLWRKSTCYFQIDLWIARFIWGHSIPFNSILFWL